MKHKFYIKATLVKHCDVMLATDTEEEKLTLTIEDYNNRNQTILLSNREGICIFAKTTDLTEKEVNVTQGDVVTVVSTELGGLIEIEYNDRLKTKQVARTASGCASLPKINLKDYL